MINVTGQCKLTRIRTKSGRYMPSPIALHTSVGLRTYYQQQKVILNLDNLAGEAIEIELDATLLARLVHAAKDLKI